MRLYEIKATPYKYGAKYLQHAETPTLQAEFTTRDGSTVSARVVYIKAQKQILINFSKNDQHKLSGQGDQFKILFTVLDFYQKALPKMIQTFPTDSVTFSADAGEPSRVKLYRKRAVPEFSKILGSEWNPAKESNSTFGKSSDVEFTWERKEPTVDKNSPAAKGKLEPGKPYRSLRRRD